MEAFMLYATIRNTPRAEQELGSSEQDRTQDRTQVSTREKILAFCSSPHSKTEIVDHCGYKNTKGFTARYLKPLLESGLLQMTIPGKPNSRSQKYVAVDTAQEKQP